MIKVGIDTLDKGLDIFKGMAETMDKYSLASFALFLAIVIYVQFSQNIDKNTQIIELSKKYELEMIKCDSMQTYNLKHYSSTLYEVKEERDSLKYLVRFLNKRIK